MRSAGASRGFTVVEIMVALAVVTLLSVLAVPSFRQWTNNQQTRTVGESLLSALQLAQATAVHQSRGVVFCLTNSTPGSSLVTTDNSACAANGKNWFAQLTKLFSDETVSGANYYVQGGSFGDIAPNVVITGPADITFNSMGRIPTSESYKLTNAHGDGRFLAVIVDIGGQIRLCDGSRSNQTSPDGCPATLP